MNIYNTIETLNLLTKDKLTKKTIEKIIEDIKVNETLGEIYFNSYCKKNKVAGVVYTPNDIVKFMIREFISEEQVINNPYIRICDPSCGAGFFLIELYKYLKCIYEKNIETINETYNLSLNNKKIGEHIITNNLFGFDLDKVALQIAIIDMFKISKNVSENIKETDFLLDNNEKFDIIIGNPPYIGHKEIDKNYSIKMREKFKNIYVNKSDLCFCFIKKSIDSIDKDGRVIFITSRYLIEGNSAINIRKYVLETASIKTIIDYYGIRPFKGVGVDPAIIEISNNKRHKAIDIIRPNLNNGQADDNFHENLINKNLAYNNYKVDLDKINHYNKWLIVDQVERNIIKKIEDKSSTSMKEIGDFNQGIITGCDKAFILERCEIDKLNIEESLVKRWIKSTDITRGKLNESNKYLIYTNDIDKIEKFPDLERWLLGYRDKLENRRECKKNLRKWYELQWARRKALFEEEKIIFPYKAAKNSFIINKGMYFSADIYSFSVNYKCINNMCILLNSNIYEFYMKCIIKKLGDKMYEYYPNLLRNIHIPNLELINVEITEEYLNNYFKFTSRELKVIEKYIK